MDVLLVVTEPDLQLLYRLLLQQAGMTVTSVASGQAAFATLPTNPAQVVITDYCLPDMPVVSFMAELRTRCPQARVLVMSDEITRWHGAGDCGGDGWYLKGDPLNRLLDQVRSWQQVDNANR